MLWVWSCVASNCCAIVQLLQMHYVEGYWPLLDIEVALNETSADEDELLMDAASGTELTVTMNKRDVLYVSARGMSQPSRVVTADIETCIGVMHIITAPLVPDSDRDEPRVASDSRAVRAGGGAVAPVSSDAAIISAEHTRSGEHAYNTYVHDQ